MGEKGDKGADGQCENCWMVSTAEFPFGDAEHDQEDKRRTHQELGANKDLVKQDMKSKIRLF